MAAIGTQTAEFSAFMKTRYLGPINDAVVRSRVLLDRLDKKNDEFEFSGNKVVIPIITARNPAVGSREDTDSGGPKLPAHGRETYTNATYNIVLHYGRASISGAVGRRSRDKEGAFARALDTATAGLMKSLPDDLNRQICGLGNGRAFSLIGGHTNTFNINADARQNFQVRVGDRVAYCDRGAPASSIDPTTGAVVTAITLGTGNTHTLVLSAASAASMTTGDGSFYFGKPDANDDIESLSHGTDMYGLQALVDDGDIGADETTATEAAEVHTGSITKFAGITRSSTPAWQSKVITNPVSSGTKRVLTETVLLQAHLHATTQGGANSEDIELYMDVSMWGTLGMAQVGTRIYNDYQGKVEHGWQYITVNGSKAFYDRDLPPNRIFYLNMKDIFLLTQGGYEMIDDDGKVLRVIAGGGRDAWEFSVRRDMNLAARGLRGHVQLRDLLTTMTVQEAVY